MAVRRTPATETDSPTPAAAAAAAATEPGEPIPCVSSVRQSQWSAVAAVAMATPAFSPWWLGGQRCSAAVERALGGRIGMRRAGGVGSFCSFLTCFFPLPVWTDDCDRDEAHKQNDHVDRKTNKTEKMKIRD